MKPATTTCSPIAFGLSPGVLGDTHYAVALEIGGNGALSQHGEPVALPARASTSSSHTTGQAD